MDPVARMLLEITPTSITVNSMNSLTMLTNVRLVIQLSSLKVMDVLLVLLTVFTVKTLLHVLCADQVPSGTLPTLDAPDVPCKAADNVKPLTNVLFVLKVPTSILMEHARNVTDHVKIVPVQRDLIVSPVMKVFLSPSKRIQRLNMRAKKRLTR
jgi:hypothetical protein